MTAQSAASSGPAARVVLLVVSAISFGTIWDVATRTGVPLWKRTQVGVGVLVSVGGFGASVIVSRGGPLDDTVFNAVSASTTSGLSAGSGYRVTAALAAVAMVSMLIGGAVGSTAGGIKIARVAWLAKATRRWLPSGAAIADDIPHVWDAQHVAADDARLRITGAAALVSSWLALLAVGVVGCTSTSISLVSPLSTVFRRTS